jgi:hypothetical protein
MPKLYNQNSLSKEVKTTGPRPETVDRLLAFSKALSITRYKNMTFDTLNN